jgi:hypothetical protein
MLHPLSLRERGIGSHFNQTINRPGFKLFGFRQCLEVITLSTSKILNSCDWCFRSVATPLLKEKGIRVYNIQNNSWGEAGVRVGVFTGALVLNKTYKKPGSASVARFC